MTPQELVEILKRHERYVAGQPHGTRAILENQDLSGLRLPGLNLSQAVLAGSNFTGCQMTGTRLVEADLFAAQFRDARLSDVCFDKADLRGADFQGATITDSTFRDADLRPGNMLSKSAGSAATNFSFAALDGITFEHAKMNGVNLQ